MRVKRALDAINNDIEGGGSERIKYVSVIKFYVGSSEERVNRLSRFALSSSLSASETCNLKFASHFRLASTFSSRSLANAFVRLRMQNNKTLCAARWLQLMLCWVLCRTRRRREKRSAAE